MPDAAVPRSSVDPSEPFPFGDFLKEREVNMYLTYAYILLYSIFQHRVYVDGGYSLE